MAKKVKEHYVGARVDLDELARLNAYTEVTEMSMGDLIRKAITEFTINHPIKQPIKSAVDSLKPGEDS